jgi:multidrug efflux pump subunit AcrB
MRAAIPEDIRVDFAFDQSGYVTRAIRSLATEGVLGALLSGLMVLLFLRHARSSAIVVATIPLALLGAVVALWGAGQTLNVMTLGGLTLAIGMLVDESTVAIENIHAHFARGKSRARAVLDGVSEVSVPMLLAMFHFRGLRLVLHGASAAPSSSFALSVGFAMAASFFLSRTLVPIPSPGSAGGVAGRKASTHGFSRYRKLLERSVSARRLVPPSLVLPGR